LRCLDDNDITLILGAVGHGWQNLPDEQRYEFKQMINTLIAWRISSNVGGRPLHQRIEQLKKIRNAAEKLEKALQEFGVECLTQIYDVDALIARLGSDTALSDEFRLQSKLVAMTMAFQKPSVQQLEANFTGVEIDRILKLGLSRSATIKSREAIRIVSGAILSVRQLGELAGIAELHVARLKSGGKRQEEERYEFILSLSWLYQDFFGGKVKATRESNWYSFLATVLSCCEGSDLNSDNVHSVFGRTVKWTKSVGVRELGRPLARGEWKAFYEGLSRLLKPSARH
jgi:hypothetical protein